IRQSLATQYRGYPGLERGALPPTRSEFRRWRDKIDDQTFVAFCRLFEELTCELARRLGMFDPGMGSWTHLDPSTLLVGDGTHLTPRFDAKPGEAQWNDEELRWEQKPFDPDAALVEATDTETGDRVKVWGLRFGFIEGWLPHFNERLILSVFNIGP